MKYFAYEKSSETYAEFNTKEEAVSWAIGHADPEIADSLIIGIVTHRLVRTDNHAEIQEVFIL